MATWAREMPITGDTLNLLIHNVNQHNRSGLKMIRPLVTQAATENSLQLKNCSGLHSCLLYYYCAVQGLVERDMVLFGD